LTIEKLPKCSSDYLSKFKNYVKPAHLSERRAKAHLFSIFHISVRVKPFT